METLDFAFVTGIAHGVFKGSAHGVMGLATMKLGKDDGEEVDSAPWCTTDSGTNDNAIPIFDITWAMARLARHSRTLSIVDSLLAIMENISRLDLKKLILWPRYHINISPSSS